MEQEIARRKGVLVDEDSDMKKKYVQSLMSDHRLHNSKPRQDNIWSIYVEALKHIIHSELYSSSS